MKEFRSFLSPQIHSFIRYRQASQRWNDSSYEENLMLFDHYCHANDPCATALTQEMVDGWCRQRRTETNNSCRSRIYVVDSFVRFLNMRACPMFSRRRFPGKKGGDTSRMPLQRKNLSGFSMNVTAYLSSTAGKKPL